MEIEGSVALVTGADRGLGRVFAQMSAGLDVPKVSPESVAQQAFDAVEAGEIEVLADEQTRTVKAQLPRDHELIYAPLQQEFFGVPAKGSG